MFFHGLSGAAAIKFTIVKMYAKNASEKPHDYCLLVIS